MKRKFETQINIKAADYSISYSQATSSDGTFSDIDDSFASALEQVNNSFVSKFNFLWLGWAKFRRLRFRKSWGNTATLKSVNVFWEKGLLLLAWRRSDRNSTWCRGRHHWSMVNHKQRQISNRLDLLCILLVTFSDFYPFLSNLFSWASLWQVSRQLPKGLQ